MKFNVLTLAAAAVGMSAITASPALALVTPGENGDQGEISTTGNDYQGIVDNLDATEAAGIVVLVASAVALVRVARMGAKSGLGMIR